MFSIEKLDAHHILAQIGEDVTVMASEGRLPAFFGREEELARMVKILGRRRKCNPLILGGAGVGKSSLCYALADRIVKGKVPPWLVGRKVIRTSFFEIWGSLLHSDEAFAEYARILKNVLKQCRENPVILFMDEFHTLVNFPVSSNVIKPALADGSLHMIAATTLREYRRDLEGDEALTRRFVPIMLDEPSPAETRRILSSLKKSYEEDYPVSIGDDFVDEVVDLTETYLPGRNQPDKSIDLLELSCIETVYDRLNGGGGGERMSVTEDTAHRVISSMTGIPEEIVAGKMDRLESLTKLLSDRYSGQEEALKPIAFRLALTKSRVGIDAHRPDGIFLVAGERGSGKTELARTVVDFLSEDPEEDFLSIDMEVYGDFHSFVMLMGGGPGRSSLLSEFVRNRPTGVILLRNFDRADKKVLSILRQIFETGKGRDYQGKELVFDHVTFFLTTRVGFEEKKPIGIVSECENVAWEQQEDAVLDGLGEVFPEDFLSSVDELIVLKPVCEEMIRSLLDRKIEAWSRQVGKTLRIEQLLKDLLLEILVKEESPAHALSRVFDREVGEDLLRLRRSREWEELESVELKRDGEA
ncbi:MAG: ATP-dependent Clp protease ATP-binding subunit [Deltaproteobacteria bacterium]|nr:ATP-dependent Clp protease ATP-binding subunit [Deltaproteobacteria bacterium]